MQFSDVNHLKVADTVDDEKDQKRWSSIAGKSRKQRLALLHGFVIIIIIKTIPYIN